MPVPRDLFCDGSYAHSSLKGTVAADQFTDGKLLQVATPVADLHNAPNQKTLARQILYGHPVRQLENTNGLSRDETSGYVGYVHPYALSQHSTPTHRVATRATLLFDAPDIKSPKPLLLSLGALLSVQTQSGRFCETTDGQFALAAHLAPVSTVFEDIADTAQTVLGTPYLWGGNSAGGIDCSGLVQLALQAAHYPCPGDSDQQCATLGTAIKDGCAPRRGDLMFWKGHVAIVFDDTTVIHANAHHMAVAFEAIDEAVARIKKQGDGPVIAIKRL